MAKSSGEPENMIHVRPGQVKTQIRVQRLGFVVKTHMAEAAEMAAEVARFVFEKGYKVVFAQESAKVARSLEKSLQDDFGRKAKVGVVKKEKLPESSDLIVVLGGDGTFLSVARTMRARSVPVLGINMGALGFLAEIKKDEAFDVLSRILDRKEVTISERALMEVIVRRNNRTVFTGPVVNDAVLSKASIARIVGIDVEVDGCFVNNVRADGLIVSTPTGSTAYSLSAGGPVLKPGLPALMMTPICAHSLSQRPLVIPNDLEITLRMSGESEQVVLTLDGQDIVPIKAKDVIHIRRFKKHYLKLVTSPTRDYFTLLREKFRFGVEITQKS